MAIVIESGVDIGPGIDIGGTGGSSPTLLLELDAQDYSGSGSTWPANTGSDATLYNTPTYTASSPTYFSFNKNSFEYADTADLGNLSTWTVEAWFRVTSSLTGQVMFIVGNEFDLSTNINFGIGTGRAPASYNIAVGLFDNGWQNTTGFAPTQNTWYYVVGTYDGSTIKQYNNGSLSTSLSYSGTPASGGTVRIARRWDSSATSATNFFPGDVAIARVYSGAKDATAITNSWNTDKARFGY